MRDSELSGLQKQYIDESNAFLECLRQKVGLDILNKKREKIKEISRLIDQMSKQTNDPSSTEKRAR